MQKQAALYNDATILLWLHGAAMANLVFLPNNATALQIVHRTSPPVRWAYTLQPVLLMMWHMSIIYHHHCCSPCFWYRPTFHLIIQKGGTHKLHDTHWNIYTGIVLLG